MANPNVSEIAESRAVATGAISVAPVGSALPTDATTALDAAFKGLGYVGPAGVAHPRAVGTDEQKDMNGDTVFRMQNDFSRTYQAELLQAENVDIKKMIFGSANVVVTAATALHGTQIAVADKGIPGERVSLVVDVFSGAKRHREVVTIAQPTEVEQGPLVGTAVRSYTVTWQVFKDPTTNSWVNEYDDDGITDP
jgi:hypothetical protein